MSHSFGPLYYASKAYVLSFSEALRQELASARSARDDALSRFGSDGISGAGRA